MDNQIWAECWVFLNTSSPFIKHKLFNFYLHKVCICISKQKSKVKGADINCNFLLLACLWLWMPRGLETMLTVRYPVTGVLMMHNCWINTCNFKRWREPSPYSWGNWSPRKSSDWSKVTQLVGEWGFKLEPLDSGSSAPPTVAQTQWRNPTLSQTGRGFWLMDRFLFNLF